MLNGRTAAMILVIGCWVVGAGLAQNPPAAPNAAVAPAANQGQAQDANRPAPQPTTPVAVTPVAAAAGNIQATLADNWNDFLHYTKIGRFDLAKGYGQAILQNKANPADLFKLVQDNPQGYETAMKFVEAGQAQDQELAQVTQQLLALVEQGAFSNGPSPSSSWTKFGGSAARPGGR